MRFNGEATVPCEWPEDFDATCGPSNRAARIYVAPKAVDFDRKLTVERVEKRFLDWAPSRSARIILAQPRTGSAPTVPSPYRCRTRSGRRWKGMGMTADVAEDDAMLERRGIRFAVYPPHAHPNAPKSSASGGSVS